MGVVRGTRVTRRERVKRRVSERELVTSSRQRYTALAVLDINID